MYNEKRKTEYINAKMERSIISTNLKSIFIKVEPREISYGRDICEWTSEEILEFYRYYSSKSVQTLIVMNNSLSSYTNWCISNGLVSDNQNHFQEIDSEALSKCVNTNGLSNIILTRKQILDIVDQLPNYTDRYVFLGLFEGITSKDGFIGKVKENDISNGTLINTNGVELHLSKELIHIVHLANEETIYEYMGSNIRRYTVSYIETDTILKPFNNKTSSNNIQIMVGRRVRSVCKYLGIAENLTIKSIQESGRIHFIKEFAKENNIDPELLITDVRRREKHEAIYGRIQNYSIYLNMYGEMLNGGGE